MSQDKQYATPRLRPQRSLGDYDVNAGLSVVAIYRSAVGYDNAGSYGWVGDKEIHAFSSSFCCEPQTALKK